MYSADSIGEIVAWDFAFKTRTVNIIESLPLNKPTGDLLEEGDGGLKRFRPHETGIFDVKLLGSNLNDVEIWTASADKTSRLVSLTTGIIDLTLEHPDFVKCVLPIPALNMVVTACRDGDVRVWDSSTGELMYRLLGHWAEVTGILIRGSGASAVIATVGIDGTVRSWSLDRDRMARNAAEGAEQEARNWSVDEEPAKKSVHITAEEEPELAELMDDE
jgi:WD40 repeat protein